MDLLCRQIIGNSQSVSEKILHSTSSRVVGTVLSQIYGHIVSCLEKLCWGDVCHSFVGEERVGEERVFFVMTYLPPSSFFYGP